MSGLAEVVGLAVVTLALLTWVIVALFAPLGSRVRVGPRRRAFVARAWLFAVLWVPPLVVGAALLPGLVSGIGGQGDHCLVDGHGHHHHHLCLLHPPHATGHWLTWVAPLSVAVVVALVWLRWAVRARRQARLARTLIATSRASQLGADVRVLEQHEPLAFTVGVREPTILLSTGLLEHAGARVLDVVLAHERAHVARRDTRRARIDSLVAALLPGAIAGGLLEHITLAREQACDAAAVERIGDPIEVARALMDIARLGMRAPVAGVSVASGALEARVHHLLEPPRATTHDWVAPALLVVALLLAGAGPVHAAVEHFITFMLH